MQIQSLWIAVALLAPTCLTAQTSKPAEYGIELRENPKPHFLLLGQNLSLVGKPTEAFWVSVESKELANPPKLLGSYTKTETGIAFEPKFPLNKSLKYRVHVGKQIRQRLPTAQNFVFDFGSPAAKNKKAKVTAIYPSQDKLPANVLKFYVHFSQPMSRGDAYEHIELRRGSEIVEHPFLELGEELWNRDQTRFTLFIHPGRIKRGLKSREVQGPAISSGEEYTLSILPSWIDADGAELTEVHRKKFQVIAPDHEQPSLESWKIGTPKAESRDPVTLTFNEPLDHGMLQRVLVVQDQFQAPIDGTINVEQSETRWAFAPTKPWAIGTYNIIVAANLEDRSGNSIARPFEVKMQKNVAAKPTTSVAIEFIVK